MPRSRRRPAEPASTSSAPTATVATCSPWSSMARASRSRWAFWMIIAGFVGVIVGAVAGFWGGRVDNILMRIVDVLFADPVPVRHPRRGAASSASGDVISMILIFGLLSWPLIARLVRASFLSLREADFVDAARAVGVGRLPHRVPAHPAQRPRAGHRRDDPADGRRTSSSRRSCSFLNFGISATQVTLGQRAVQRPERAQPGQLVVGVLPGHGHRADRHRHQLHRRRAARRPRPADAGVTR